MDREEWERICNQCGKCCYEKIDLGGGIIRYTDEPCQYLDTGTKRCSVYETRQEVEPDCMSLTEELVRTLWWLPEDCAYLAHVRHLETLTAVRKAQSAKKKRRRARRKQ